MLQAPSVNNDEDLTHQTHNLDGKTHGRATYQPRLTEVNCCFCQAQSTVIASSNVARPAP